MIGVENVGAVLPDVGVAKTLFAQGCRQLFLVNASAHAKLDTMRRPRVSSQPDEFSATKPFRPAKARYAKTATPLSLPFLATEKRRARCLQERRSLETDLESGCGAVRRRRSAALAAKGALAHMRRRVFHGVIGRNSEESRIRSSTLDVGNVVSGFADERVGALALHDHLQVGRIPFFIHDDDRLVVAHMARGDG